MSAKREHRVYTEWNQASFVAGHLADICNMLFEVAQLALHADGDIKHPEVQAWLRQKNRESDVDEFRLTFNEDYTRLQYWIGHLGSRSVQLDLVPLQFWVRRLESEFEKLPPPTSLAKNKRRISVSLRYKILKRDSFCCVLCGASGREDSLHIDHIFPFSEGGTSAEDNLRTLCRACNSGKRDKIE